MEDITKEEVIEIVDSIVQKHLGNIIFDNSLETMRYEIDSLKLEVYDVGRFAMSIVDMIYPSNQEQYWSEYELIGKHTDSIDLNAYHNSRTIDKATKRLEEVYN
jgi:hypothetical protein